MLQEEPGRLGTGHLHGHAADGVDEMGGTLGLHGFLVIARCRCGAYSTVTVAFMPPS